MSEIHEGGCVCRAIRYRVTWQRHYECQRVIARFVNGVPVVR